MQQTGFLPIPNGHSGPGGGSSFPRQSSGFNDMAQPMQQSGPQPSWDQVAVSGLSAMMRSNGTPPGQASSPSSNPHSGFHPGSFGPLSFSALALGATATPSSPYSSSMAMSISPPRWQPGSLGGGFGGGGGSYVGSVGALSTSFGRQTDRERELEAKYVRDFTCCGKQLSGLHELLEHYEEEHANLAPDVRMAAITAVSSTGVGMPMPLPLHHPGAKRTFSSSGGMINSAGDAPQPPGMMDIEMDDVPPTSPQVLLQQASIAGLGVNMSSPPPTASPWSAAFRPPSLQPPACVPPSVLSYAPPAPAAIPSVPSTPTQARAQPSASMQPGLAGSDASQPASATKIIKKIVKKDKDDEDQDPPGEKRFRCPIEGCGKVYKQANGLKYHLTRSINSGHGNVAAMGGLLSLLDNSNDDK